MPDNFGRGLHDIRNLIFYAWAEVLINRIYSLAVKRENSTIWDVLFPKIPFLINIVFHLVSIFFYEVKNLHTNRKKNLLDLFVGPRK